MLVAAASSQWEISSHDGDKDSHRHIEKCFLLSLAQRDRLFAVIILEIDTHTLSLTWSSSLCRRSFGCFCAKCRSTDRLPSFQQLVFSSNDVAIVIVHRIYMIILWVWTMEYLEVRTRYTYVMCGVYACVVNATNNK